MDWTHNTIWYDQLETSNYFIGDLHSSANQEKIQNVEYVMGDLKRGNYSFEKMPEMNRILFMEINCSNIYDFEGIEKLKNLKRLELHYCRKLETDKGISKLSETIEWLHIDMSKKFQMTNELLQLKKLKVLCLNSCGPLENLGFLSAFPNLIDFRIVDTNVLDGDLSPILAHPKIKNAAFLNKRHYNLKDTDVKEILNRKVIGIYKSIVKKGKFETYKYL